MKNYTRYCLFICLVMTTNFILAPVIHAAERNNMEKYCVLSDYPKALRQTIILLDENVFVPQTGKEIPPNNMEIIRLIRSFTDPQKARSNGAFLPREPLIIYALPRDGSQPRLVFSGCQPFYSQQEEKEILSKKSKWERRLDNYFGKGKINDAIEYADTFKRSLGRSLKRMQESTISNAGPSKASDFFDSSLIASLQSATRLVNLHEGLPRIFLFSDFAPFVFRVEEAGSHVDARNLGFSMAKQANINFSRAELYAINFHNSNKNSLVKEFAHAFFLGSGALLAGWSNRSIGNLLTNPSHMQIYQGIIDYITTKPPIKVRLAWDRNGTLVNSWITVSLKSTVSTPMSGAIICETENKCKIKSDDSGFAQIWTVDPDDEPEYDPKIPFSGLRYFEIEILGNKGRGRIWDPAVDKIGGRENLPFDLTLVKEGVF